MTRPAESSTATVGVVMLAFGDEPWLPQAISAVLNSMGAEVNLVLVDNGCTSDAVDRVKDTPRVTVLRPAENLGYTGGCRLGAAEAHGEFLAFVNSDAIVDPGALARISTVAAEEGVGLAMGSIRLAEAPDLINTAGNPLHVAGLSWAGGNGSPATLYAQRRQVPAGSGCCFVIRRTLWDEVGGFADEYFAYHEDTELSLRLWQRGLTVEYVPDAVVRHHYQFSRNERKLYLLERNRLALVLTGFQRRTLILLVPVLVVTEAGMLVAALTGRWLGAKIRGWRWLWNNRDWVRARRRQLQVERRVPDAHLAPMLTARFDPTNLEAPRGVGVYNALVGGYWRLVRPLLPRR